MPRSLLLSLALCCAPTLAADVPDSQDLDILPRFPRAEIVDYREAASEERRYPMDGVRRISGQLRMSREALVLGELKAITYRLPDEHAPSEALNQARATLTTRGAQLLFWCEGRNCGSSSLLANAIFGNSKLYGPEERQSYLLFRLAEPQQDSLVALYGITRGNRRSYLHVEQLNAAAPLAEILPTPATLLRQLREQGQLAFPGLTSVQENWSDLLARTLLLDSTLRVRLESAEAEQWAAALEQRRVRASRLETGNAEGPGLLLRMQR